jgi:hypothetical protein
MRSMGQQRGLGFQIAQAQSEPVGLTTAGGVREGAEDERSGLVERWGGAAILPRMIHPLGTLSWLERQSDMPRRHLTGN